MRQGRLTTLTGIRGVAAVWVVVFHAYPFAGELLGWPMRWQIPVVRSGFLAVDLFFVLSGFVLSNAYSERFYHNFRSSLGEFLFARVCRIFPLHWVCLTAFFLLVMYFPHHWWGPGPFTLSALVASVGLVQNWIPSTAMAWNHPTWSLSAEWFAYLLFPFLVPVINRLKDRRLALAGSFLSLLLLYAALVVTDSGTLNHVGPAGIVRCLCEFSAGVLAWKAVSAEARKDRTLAEVCTVLGMAILALAVATPRMERLAPFAFVMLVVGCALSSRIATCLFGGRGIVFLGEISFSIYLVHVGVLGLLGLIADALPMDDTGAVARVGLVLAISPLVVITSYVTWRFVEQPSQAFARTHARGATARVLAWFGRSSLTSGRLATATIKPALPGSRGPAFPADPPAPGSDTSARPS